jgi:uncharacterized damage-inducible protein DinB
MFRKIDDFVSYYQERSDEHMKLFERLADNSLAQAVGEGHRQLGQLAWHIVQSIPGMAKEVNLDLDKTVESRPVPTSAEAIAGAYRACADELIAKVKSTWTDADLEIEDNMYGSMWKRGYTLMALTAHEGHHIGQMTVLIRQAGLPVYGIYGPSKEEWAQYGMEQPPGLA